ncbi:hypothetical protein GQ457_11G022350 [Hibiscus cannabinus]
MECVDPTTARKLVSYKDIVIGPNDPHRGFKNVDLDDHEIELLEDDMAFGLVKSIPTIDFFERLKNLAIKSMDLTLVVKLCAYDCVLMSIGLEFRSLYSMVVRRLLSKNHYRRFAFIADVGPHVLDEVLGSTTVPSHSIPKEAFSPRMLVEKGNKILEIMPESHEFVLASIVATLVQSNNLTIPVELAYGILAPSRLNMEKI